MLVSSPKDGGSMFLQNAGIYLQVHKCYNPEDQHQHFDSHENLKSHDGGFSKTRKYK
jgi:hypothetical protein